MIKLGVKLFLAAKRGHALDLRWVSKMPKGMKFDLKNPYILEALVDTDISKLAKYEGQSLVSVCRMLNRTPARKGFDDAELLALYKKAFSNGKPAWDTNSEAGIYLSQLSENVGSKFDAHGLAKDLISDQLRQLNTLLTKGVDPARNFHTAPLVVKAENARGLGAGLGTNGGHVYYDGSFILVGAKGKMIEQSGIRHVIVNDAYYKIIDDLRLRFPDVNFVAAENAVEYFNKL